MEFYEVIEKRRSIRQFEDKAIPTDMLERILAAGLQAPSSNHQRQWQLVTLTDKAVIRELAKFIKPYPCRITEPKTPQQEMFKIAYPRQRTMVEEAACVILPYFKCKYDMKSTTNDYGLTDYGAAWALVENILLAATAEGLGSVVHIPVKKEPEQIKAFMNIPDGYILPTLIMLGYSSKDALIPTQVKATVENRVHWNKW
ncbi:nitroreductase family protein [Bittarella massiliensis (ex Durand et al. 2017)]|uniref:Nitroreductase family protein n=1 Tax=Bittarella massiliensis (ex Durand et al. 2017) TaxID=1720313 RepID=A0AAW5KBN8_9FIRM|nr:nitroreductase family protein [Bittarella massiliensis (ex Durand et al. 2017)]MCQ4949703.1 nitroreductase family protein [Bittarella massiliensis (ex Durand et al. 2017)]